MATEQATTPEVVDRLSALTAEEQVVLRAEGRLFTCIATALLRIADECLYSARGFDTFAEYIDGTPQLGFGVRRAKQYLTAARFMRWVDAGHPVANIGAPSQVSGQAWARLGGGSVRACCGSEWCTWVPHYAAACTRVHGCYGLWRELHVGIAQ